MRNLADAIENFIIRQLLEDREDAVLVQRNNLPINCRVHRRRSVMC